MSLRLCVSSLRQSAEAASAALELRAKAEGFGLRRSALVACAALALIAGALAYAPQMQASKHTAAHLGATLCLEGEDGWQVRLYESQQLSLGGEKYDRCRAPSEAQYELLRSTFSSADEHAGSWTAQADRICVAASKLSHTAAWSGTVVLRRGRPEPGSAAVAMSVECN